MTFNFNVTADQRKHGQPYVATLVLDAHKKIAREFFDLDRAYGKRTVTVYGTVEAEDGALIEARVSDGSWKNDDRVIWLVWNGRRIAVADPDVSSNMPLVHAYLATGTMPREWSDKITKSLGCKDTRPCWLASDPPTGVIVYAGTPVDFPEVN